MQLIPKFDRVLIKRAPVQAKGSTIILPESVVKANQTERGEVLAVGPTAGVWGKDGVRMEGVVVGEHVVFAKHAGVEVKLDGESYFLIQDTDIHASYIED